MCLHKNMSIIWVNVRITFSASDNIKKWWIWGYWISPLMYGQNAIAVNEFLGHSWKQVRIVFFNAGYMKLNTTKNLYNSDLYHLKFGNSFI